MLGSIISGIAGLAGGLFNAKKQEDFAKNSITWKAQDAERAGISKIFAMGAPTTSFAPVSTGDFSNFGNELDKKMGQGGPQSTTTGKVTGINSEIQRAQLDGIRIDNDIKRAELSSKINIATQPGAGGVLDRDVTTGPNGVTMKKEIEPSGHGSGNKSFGVSPEVSMYRTKDGFAPQIPQQLQEAFESDALSRWQWNARNKILPYYSMQKYGTEPYQLEKDGSYWTYSPFLGEYVRVPKGGNKHGPTPAAWEYIMDRLRR